MVIQAYAPTSNVEEAEVEQFYEDLQDLLELTPKKDVLFIIGDWNAKIGSQETPGVTGKFGLGVQNEAGQRLIEFCQENALVIAKNKWLILLVVYVVKSKADLRTNKVKSIQERETAPSYCSFLFSISINTTIQVASALLKKKPWIGVQD